MAAPTYTTDLATINLMTGSHVELTGATEGRITDNDPDNFIAGTNCATSQTRTGGDVSIAHPSNTVTIPAGAAVFSWTYHGAMPTVDTFVNDGIRICIGNSSANYNQFTIYGRDTLPKGGWYSSAVDPTSTPDLTQGSPTSVTSTFGSRTFMTAAVSKGNPFAIDYSRYGRSLIVDEGEIAIPATFLGAATQNDLVANKWGLFEVSAGGFSHKGLFQIGTVASAAFFEDSNKNIVLEDNLHCAAGFTEYEVINTGTKVIWTGIQISALGTTTRGLFTVTDNAVVEITDCTFNDMSDFSFLSNTVVVGTVFRRCNLVTQGGSSITSSTFSNSTAATSLLASDMTLVTGNSFVSDGSNHAVELTSIGGGSIDWDNQLTGYVAGTAASPVTATSTGNEAIYVNVASGTLTINVTAGASVPSIRSAGAIVNVVAGAVTYKITVQDTAGTVIQDARVFFPVAAGGSLFFQASVTIARIGTLATVTHTNHGLSNGDKIVIRGVDQSEYYGIHTVSNVTTNTYDYIVSGSPTTPATGTITSTYVLISALTDVLGVVQGSKTFATNQPIGGNVRKSSASPYYKTGAIVGSINKDTGLDLTITLLSDE